MGSKDGCEFKFFDLFNFLKSSPVKKPQVQRKYGLPGSEYKFMDLFSQKNIFPQEKKPDRREYTLMFVPHHNTDVISLRVSFKALKYSAAILSVLLVLMIGALVTYQHEASVASTQREELKHLRAVNASQSTQLDELAKNTAGLQGDLTRLDRLDSELRRLVNSDSMSTSRSGIDRPSVTSHSGQGGPIVKPQISELNNLVRDMRSDAKAREQSLIELRELLAERNARLAATPSIWPAAGEITSPFGWRSSPWGEGGDWHPGIDIASDYGTPIVATADGEVIYANWYNGYGNLVQIDHGYGIVTFYGHTCRMIVGVGDRVKKGQVIAYMGSTGNSTGTHVHYEIRVNGTAVNPANYL